MNDISNGVVNKKEQVTKKKHAKKQSIDATAPKLGGLLGDEEQEEKA